jgi:hypothetical protein
MRKARLGIQSGEVREVIRTYAVEIQTDEKKELQEDSVMMLVRRAMGANCKCESVCGWACANKWQTIDRVRHIRLGSMCSVLLHIYCMVVCKYT